MDIHNAFKYIYGTIRIKMQQSPEQFIEYHDKGITGLANVGNTCYVNSCIQCLSHTYELNNFLDSGTYQNRLNRKPDSVLLVEWDNLRKMMWKQKLIMSV